MPARINRPQRPLPLNSTDFNRQLGRRVAMLRRDRFMSQAGLADAAELSTEVIGRLERALREPRVSTLCSVANGLDVTLSVLVDLGLALPPPRQHRPDVDAIASFLDDKSARDVSRVASFIELFFSWR